MNGEGAYQLWAAASGRWSRWLKPSLFAKARIAETTSATEWPRSGWLPDAGETAIVLDLRGPAAIPLAASLNQRGYCPVPMYNTTSDLRETVATDGIAEALLSVAEKLVVNASGPPVFLLDQLRNKPRWGENGDYGNSWSVFSSDFPTAMKFEECGVKKLIVVTPHLDEDLHDSLSKHLTLQPTLLDPETERSTPFPPPRVMLWRGLSEFGRSLRRNGKGTFGSRIHRSGG